MLLLKSLFVAIITFFLSCIINLRIVKFRLEKAKNNIFYKYYESNVDFNITWEFEDFIEFELKKLQKQFQKMAYIVALSAAIFAGTVALMIFSP